MIFLITVNIKYNKLSRSTINLYIANMPKDFALLLFVGLKAHYKLTLLFCRAFCIFIGIKNFRT